MKVGSIVECVDAGFRKSPNPLVKYPVLKGIYTVREIIKDDVVIIRLEEIINPACPKDGKEYAFDIDAFRELLPPMEIQDALDSCEPVLIEINNK